MHKCIMCDGTGLVENAECPNCIDGIIEDDTEDLYSENDEN